MQHPQMAAVLPSFRDARAASAAAVYEVAKLEALTGERRLARATLGETGKRQSRTEADAILRALEPFFEGVKVVDGEGVLLRETGEKRLELEVAGRSFLVSVDTFFQGNRHLAGRLMTEVADASGKTAGDALDTFAGVGFFAAGLLEAGHSTTSVEGSAS